MFLGPVTLKQEPYRISKPNTPHSHPKGPNSANSLKGVKHAECANRCAL